MSLPSPATVGELYLAAILDELRKINGSLVKPQSVQDDSGEVDLVEPKPKHKRQSRISKVSR